jgi:hypothetical protein
VFLLEPEELEPRLAPSCREVLAKEGYKVLTELEKVMRISPNKRRPRGHLFDEKLIEK